MDAHLIACGVPPGRIADAVAILTDPDEFGITDHEQISSSCTASELHDAGLPWGDAVRVTQPKARDPGPDLDADPAALVAFLTEEKGITADDAAALAADLLAEGIAAPDLPNKGSKGKQLHPHCLFTTLGGLVELGITRLGDALMIVRGPPKPDADAPDLASFVGDACAGVSSGRVQSISAALTAAGIADVGTLMLLELSADLTQAGVVRTQWATKLVVAVRACRPLSKKVRNRAKGELFPLLEKALQEAAEQVTQVELGAWLGGGAAAAAGYLAVAVEAKATNALHAALGLLCQVSRGLECDDLVAGLVGRQRAKVGGRPAWVLLKGRQKFWSPFSASSAGSFAAMGTAAVGKPVAVFAACTRTAAMAMRALPGGTDRADVVAALSTALVAAAVPVIQDRLKSDRWSAHAAADGTVVVVFDGDLVECMDARRLATAEAAGGGGAGGGGDEGGAVGGEFDDNSDNDGDGDDGGGGESKQDSPLFDDSEPKRHNAQAVHGALHDAEEGYQIFIHYAFRAFFAHCLKLADPAVPDNHRDHISCVIYREAGLEGDPLAMHPTAGCSNRCRFLWFKSVWGNGNKLKGEAWEYRVPTWFEAFRLFTSDVSQAHLKPNKETWDAGVLMGHVERNQFIRGMMGRKHFGAAAAAVAADVSRATSVVPVRKLMNQMGNTSRLPQPPPRLAQTDEIKKMAAFQVRLNVRNKMAHSDPIPDDERMAKIGWVCEMLLYMASTDDDEINAKITKVAAKVAPLIQDRLEDLGKVLKPTSCDADIEAHLGRFMAGSRASSMEKLRTFVHGNAGAGDESGGGAGGSGGDGESKEDAKEDITGATSREKTTPGMPRVHLVIGKHGSGKSALVTQFSTELLGAGGGDASSEEGRSQSNPNSGGGGEDAGATPPLAVARFLCKSGSSLQSHPRHILCSLAFQLALQLPGYRRCLREGSFLTTEDALPTAPHDLYKLLIFEPLRTLHDRGELNGGGTVFLLIDAIDESLGEGADILDLLQRPDAPNVCMLPPGVRLLMTDVRSVKNRDVCRPVPSIDLIGHEDDDETKQDLTRYFEAALSELSPVAAAGLAGVDRNQLARDLCERSQGLFLYAHFAREMLQTGSDVAMFASRDALLSRFPRGIDRLFPVYLGRVVAALDGNSAKGLRF